jgi:protein TonB
MKQTFFKYGICLFLLLQAGISFSQQEEKKQHVTVYTTAEQMPSFPGGKDALSKYMRKHLRYPKSAMKNAVHGKVVVRFVVEADGSITHAEIISSLDSACDKEALRVVRGMPKWDPGMQNGNFVAVYYNLPITFAMF